MARSPVLFWIGALLLIFVLPYLVRAGQGSAIMIASRFGAPLIANGVAYFGTESGRFYAFDMLTGREKWHFDTPAPIFAAPVVHEGRVYFGGQDGFLHVLDIDSGEQQWAFEAGRVDWPIRDRFVNGAPSIVDNVAYFSSEDFNVYAVNATTGAEIWRFRLDEEAQAVFIPVVDGVVYVGDWDGFLYAIDAAKGTEIWRSVTDNDHIGQTVRDSDGLRWVSDEAAGELLSDQAPYVTAAPIITEAAVYFANWAGELMALDREAGQQLWRFKPDVQNIRHAGPNQFISLYDDVLYFDTWEDGHIYAVDRHSGELVWEHAAEGALVNFGSADSVALFAEFHPSTNGQIERVDLHALDLLTRRFLWTDSQLIAGAPSIHDGIVYVGGVDGTLHGLDLMTGQEVWKLE